MDGASELTVTGQVLGTPSFMPPEQAAGKHAEISARSDVYSLGALLYFLITGKPPFGAATLPETLQQVASVEPQPPRKLNPAVPRDLETICLKCLEKDSQRRYASAQELAAELQRFLRNEPILARPIGGAEKLWRLSCRHRLITSFSVIVALLTVAVAFLIKERRMNGETGIA